MTTAVGRNTIAARCNTDDRLNVSLVGGIQNQEVDRLSLLNYQLSSSSHVSSFLKEDTSETNWGRAGGGQGWAG